MGSILLAFAIDAWWASRGERSEEREALQALAEDFEAADRLLGGQVLVMDSAAAAAEAILDLVGPSADGGFADSLALLIPKIIRRPTFQPPTGTLDALLGSGALRLIRSPELKAALASFPSELEDMKETQSFGSDVVFRQLLPYLNAHVPMLRFGLMARGESDFDGSPETLLTSLEFENLAQNRLMGIRFSLPAAESVGARIHLIRELLSEELAG